MKVHIFIGQFNSPEEAKLYTEPFWEPEPDDSVSDEEWESWEERNPIFRMQTELNCHLDSDFIETISDKDKLEYLKSVLNPSEQIASFVDELNEENSTLVLIFEKAIDDNHTIFNDTSTLKYKGEFISMIE